jgi:hypothetical protein
MCVQIQYSNHRLGSIDVDMILTGAITSGTTSNHSFSDVDAQCPTSKCEWRPYNSLGVCSSVEDVSSDLIGTPIFFGNETIASSVNITLPIPELYELVFDYAGNSNHFWMVPLGLRAGEYNFKTPNVLAQIYVIYFPPCTVTNNSAISAEIEAWQPMQLDKNNWKAFKGTLELCVQTLTTSVINGTTTTHVASDRIDQGFEWLDASNTTVFYPTQDLQNSSGRVPYSMGADSMQQLSSAIEYTFYGMANLEPGGDNYWDNEVELSIAQDIYGEDALVCNPDPDLGISGFGRRLDNVAVSLTNT